VLLSGAETKKVLLLRNVVRNVRYRKSVATGKTSQSESYKRIITGGLPQGESKENIIIKAYIIGKYCYRGIVAGRKPLYYYRGQKQKEYYY